MMLILWVALLLVCEIQCNIMVASTQDEDPKVIQLSINIPSLRVDQPESKPTIILRRITRDLDGEDAMDTEKVRHEQHLDRRHHHRHHHHHKHRHQFDRKSQGRSNRKRPSHSDTRSLEARLQIKADQVMATSSPASHRRSQSEDYDINRENNQPGAPPEQEDEYAHGALSRELINGSEGSPEIPLAQAKISMELLGTDQQPHYSIPIEEVPHPYLEKKKKEAMELYDLSETDPEQLQIGAPNHPNPNSNIINDLGEHYEEIIRSVTPAGSTQVDPGKAEHCPECHGNRVCDQSSHQCLIPCGTGYPACPDATACSITGFCNHTLTESDHHDYTEGQIISSESPFVDEKNQDNDGPDAPSLSEVKILPILESGLKELRASVKSAILGMAEKFGLDADVMESWVKTVV